MFPYVCHFTSCSKTLSKLLDETKLEWIASEQIKLFSQNFMWTNKFNRLTYWRILKWDCESAFLENLFFQCFSGLPAICHFDPPWCYQHYYISLPLQNKLTITDTGHFCKCYVPFLNMRNVGSYFLWFIFFMKLNIKTIYKMRFIVVYVFLSYLSFLCDKLPLVLSVQPALM